MTIYICPSCRESFQFRSDDPVPAFCPFCGVDVAVWPYANDDTNKDGGMV